MAHWFSFLDIYNLYSLSSSSTGFVHKTFADTSHLNIQYNITNANPFRLILVFSLNEILMFIVYDFFRSKKQFTAYCSGMIWFRLHLIPPFFLYLKPSKFGFFLLFDYLHNSLISMHTMWSQSSIDSRKGTYFNTILCIYSIWLA